MREVTGPTAPVLSCKISLEGAQWLLLRERVRSLETRMAGKPDGA